MGTRRVEERLYIDDGGLSRIPGLTRREKDRSRYHSWAVCHRRWPSMQMGGLLSCAGGEKDVVDDLFPPWISGALQLDVDDVELLRREVDFLGLIAEWPIEPSAAPMLVPLAAGELLAVELTSILGRPTFSAKQIVAAFAAWPKQQFSVAVV